VDAWKHDYMSAFQFAASMVSALAWPVVVGGVLLAFRRELRRWLADRPASIKMGAFAVEWERRSAQVAVGLAESGVPASVESDLGGLAGSHLTDITGSDPAEAIKAALGKIENRLRTGLVGAGVQGIEQETLPRLALLAVQSGLIASGNADSVRGVAVMANLALVKPGKIGEREATEFLALADATLFGIDMAIRTANRQSSGAVQPV
jgi:hypothetical protein